MIQLNSSVSLMLFLPIVQTHLTLLLAQGKIFDRLFFTAWLREMRSCPMCLGFWTAVILGLFTGIRNPIEILAIAGIGHLIYLAREKYLPCEKCKIPDAIPFRVIGE